MKQIIALLKPPDHVGSEGWLDRWRDFVAELKKLQTKIQLTPTAHEEFIQTEKGKVSFTFSSMQEFKHLQGVYIHWIIADAQGAGRLAMQSICRVADAHGMWLELSPVPLTANDFTPTKAQLQRFYRSFGFVQKGIWMLRKPIKGLSK